MLEKYQELQRQKKLDNAYKAARPSTMSSRNFASRREGDCSQRER